MRYLLDTHAFLWWMTDDARLSSRVRAIIEDEDNEICFSAASAWEIAIKAQLGRIELQAASMDQVLKAVAANSFVSLPVEVRHALEVFKLPLLHRDPFDRMLIAQAVLDDLPLLTADRSIAQYPVSVIW